MIDKDKLLAKINSDIDTLEKKKAEYESLELWGDVPEMRGKLMYAYSMLEYLNSLD